MLVDTNNLDYMKFTIEDIANVLEDTYGIVFNHINVEFSSDCTSMSKSCLGWDGKFYEINMFVSDCGNFGLTVDREKQFVIYGTAVKYYKHRGESYYRYVTHLANDIKSALESECSQTRNYGLHEFNV